MEIRALGPELVEEYLALFDAAFADNPHWAGCYCAFYDSVVSDEEWDPSDPASGDRNRRDRATAILSGRADGLLALDGGTPVGWVKAAPRASLGNLRRFAVAVEPDDPPVGSIHCFVVPPPHREFGVARALLAATDDHFRTLGLAVSEAYPRSGPVPDGFPATAAYYKGTPSMYAEAGFTPHREADGFTIVRKLL